jgi:hypothetical protein
MLIVTVLVHQAYVLYAEHIVYPTCYILLHAFQLLPISCVVQHSTALVRSCLA